MFIPVYDVDNPVRRIPAPFVTFGLIAVNVIAFCAITILGERAEMAQVIHFAFKPDGVPAGAADLPFPAWEVPTYVGLLTSLFVHQDFMHLLGNMLFLWVFGDNIEDALGHWRFLAFYLLCGAASGLAQDFMTEPGWIFYGASGAVAGVVGAFLILHPKVKVWILVMMRVPLRLPAVWVLGFWIAFQVYSAVSGGDAGTGWWAHIAGFVVGVALTPLLKKPGVPLFDRGLSPGA